MTTPTITKIYDDDERELIEAIESDDYTLGESGLTSERIQALQEAAANTISEASTKVSIRILNTDLMRIKAQALREGMPYQTLIKSILHKSIS